MKYALLVFFAAGALAAPFMVLDDQLPRTTLKDVGCKSNRFRQGQTFMYDYAGETINNIAGSTPFSTGLQLKARVFITPMAECRFAMQLENAELLSKSKNQQAFTKTSESKMFKKELEQFELLFTMSGNKIYTLAAHDDESNHILNIKRGILSTLQLDESSKTETDVNGICSMDIKTENNKVIKSKNLAECSKRAQNEIGIQTASITTETSMKPLDSNTKCTYVIDGEMIKSVNCDETHLFRPFSAGYESPSGAMTTVKQTLTFVKMQRARSVSVTKDLVEKSLIFDHVSEEISSTRIANDHANQIMQRLVNSDKLSASQDSAHEFTSLVFLFRKMDEKRMKPIWNKYFDCIESKACNNENLRDLYRQYLLDAVAYCGTSTCISMVRNVIIDGQVSGERMNMFLQSIALVGKTNLKMIRHVLEIVKKQPSRQAYLTLGTLLSRHCGKAPEECVFGKSSPISQAESFLESKIGKNCGGQGNHERVEEILMALKAIGNAKRPIRVRSSLIRCGKNSQHANITQAAFEAFRGMPCDGAQSDDIMHVVTDESINPEVRINAFVALMRCPTEDVLDHVLHALETEQSKQVSSFIWSHLTNIIESSDPRHAQTKAFLKHLTESRPLKEMNLPFYKFSKSFEKSLYLDSLNSGATVDGQVIFRPDGYLPKSGLLNITANVMGVPVHLVEAVVGIDGWESVIANAVGPNGVIPDNIMVNFFNYTYTSEILKEMVAKTEEQRTRKTRGIKNKLSQIHNRVNMKSPSPSAHFSIKVMGQEVRVMSYDDIFSMIDQIDNMNVVQLLMNIAKGGQKTFSKSMMFLEMTHTVPTSLGLPLKLKLTGSTVATVELNGKFDIRNMFWGPGSLNVNGFVKPSAVVELSGQMGIDSHFVQSGVFVNSSMFVSNMVKGSLIYKEGQMFKINVDTPEEPIQLFNFSSTPFMYMNEKTDLIEGVSRKINPDFCLKSKILGYGLCSNLRLPVAFREYEAPYFPLSGPAHFCMKLVRGDEKLTTFQFLVQMTKKTSETTGLIEFSTPGATYERKLSGEMAYTDVDNTKTLILSTGKSGRKGEVEFSYNTITNRASIETKNNFFTPKDIITRLTYFNQTNMVSQQFGMLFATEYDWYKFEHVSKYVRKETGYMFHASTTYYPKKSVTGVIEYDTKEQKLTARLNSEQLKQAAAVSGVWSVEGDQEGFTLTATHLTSGKSASFYGGYVNKDNEKEIITEVRMGDKAAKNVMGYYKKNGVQSVNNLMKVGDKTARLTASYDDLKANKVLSFDADILGKKANVDYVLANTAAEKSVRMIVNVEKKVSMVKMGYYIKAALKTWKIDFDLLGKHAEIFVNVDTAEGCRTTLGATYEKYVAGIRGVYNSNHGHGKSMCTSAYYGTTASEKEPILICTNYHTLGTKYVHNRLTFSAEMKEMNKKAELEFDFEKHQGHIELDGTAKYNEKVYAKNTYDFTYGDMKNAELKMDVEIGKYISGWKISTKTTGMKTDLAVQAYVMDKTILFLNTYETTSVGKTLERQLTSQLIVNGKTFPVSTEFTHISGDGMSGPTMKLIVGKYSLAYATVVTYRKVQYGYGSEIVATNGDNILFKVYQKSELITKDKKELSQKFGITVLGKTYEYGWEASYENRGTVSKSAHAVMFQLQYSTTRKSSVTFTLANGKKAAELIIDVEYLPKKEVSHSIRYTKTNRQLDISIEFLPKMFIKYMARLDKIKGYGLTTDLSIQWASYKRSMKVFNSYTNTRAATTFSTNIGKKISFGVTYTKTSQKSVKLFANFFKYSGKVIVIASKRNVQVRFIGNNKMLMNIMGDYNRAARALTFSVSDAKKTWFKIGGDFNKFAQKLRLSVSGIKNRDLFSVSGKYSKKDKMIVYTAFALEKEIFKAVTKQIKNSASVQLSIPQFKRDVTFNAKWNKQDKSVVLSAESAGNVVGLTLRGDWKNYNMKLTGFFNKMESGLEMYLEKHAFVYKIMFTPKASVQIIFEVQDDKVLKMTIQRTIGNNVINETAFQYELSKGMCQLMFKWNPETASTFINAVTDLIQPAAEKVMNEITKFSNDAVKITKKFIKDSARDSSKAAMDFIEKMDKSFDEFDFVGVRDTVGEATLTALRKLSTLIRKTLIAAAKGLDNMKNEIPELIHKVKELAEKSKELTKKLKEVTKKAKEVTEKAKDVMKNLKISSVKNLNELNDIVVKVATNLTESTRPVIIKAIELIKDFKFRGKSVEEIVNLVNKMVQEYIKIYTDKAQVAIVDFKIKATKYYSDAKVKATKYYNVAKVKGTKYYNDAKVYILKLKVPYRDETVEEVITIVTNKAIELKGKISNADLQKMIEEVRVTIMHYKINNKPVKEHIVILKKNLKNLPETTRKAILELIRLARIYSKDAKSTYIQVAKEIKSAYTKVAKFSEPATNHIIFVAKTIQKHFGPLYNNALNKVIKQVTSIELPTVTPYVMKQIKIIKKFFLPLLKPTVALYKNLVTQVRQIRINGFTIGPLFDMNMQMMTDTANKYMKRSNKMVLKQIDILSNYVDTITAMTPEQIVDKLFVTSMEMSKNVVESLTKMYKEREAMMKNTMNKITEAYKNMQVNYNAMTSRSAEEVMETIIHQSTESLIFYTEQLSSLLKQFAGMDISGPTWKAWKSADIIGHLRKYGVNDKIMSAIKSAKDVKLTKVVKDTIKMIEKFVSDVYARAFVKAMRMVVQVERAVIYIKSIPDKEYEQWYKELKGFTLKNKAIFVKFMTTTYRMSEQSATKLYNKAKELSNKNYKDIVQNVANDYIKPVKEFYTVIAGKSSLVYDEVKQPTIDVTNHYKNIVTKFVKENYDIVYEKMMNEYNKVSKQMKEKLNELNSKLNAKWVEVKTQMEGKWIELKNKMEQQYEKFLSIYGDMTWEEVCEEFYKYGEKKTQLAKSMLEKQYKEINKMALKLKKQAEELRNKVEVRINELRKQAEEMFEEYRNRVMEMYTKYKIIAEDKYMEVRPKVVKMYNDYKNMADKQYTKALKMANKMYAEAKTKSIEIYNNNKDKTLKKIYIEIKTIIIEQFNKQYKIAATFVNKKSDEYKTLAKKYYNKAEVTMSTIIIPEILKEGESLINQTLHFTVVMANETVKAYYPHFVLIKETLNKVAVIIGKETTVAIKKSKVVFNENLEKLIKLLKDLLEKIVNHDMYKKVINHEYVTKATEKYNELIKDAEAKIEELKSHPTTLKYKKQAQEMIAEYKKQIEEYKTQLQQLYKKYSKHANVIKAKKLMKQLQKSAMFTYTKITKRIIPQLENLAKVMNIHLPNIPAAINKGLTFFRQQPEEAFWYTVATMKNDIKEIYKLRNTNLNYIKEKLSAYKDIAISINKFLYEECFDTWTKNTVKQTYAETVKFVKKTQRQLNELPEKMTKMIIKAYNKNMKVANIWVKRQYKTMVTQWNKCPFKALFTNQIWGELAEEFMRHELVQLAKTAATMTMEKSIELKKIALKEFSKQRKIAMMKYNELRTKAMNQYDDLKEMSIAKYNQMVNKVNYCINKIEKFFDETTIADIVKFTQNKYEEVVKTIQETKEKVMELKVKYTKEAKQLYAKYEKEAKIMYNKYYAKAEVLALQYKEKLMPYFLKYKSQGMKVYNKYYPIALAKYEEIYAQAEKLYKQAQVKYEELRIKSLEKYEELKLKSINMYNEYKTKATIMAKTARTDAYNKWMDSEVRSKLISMKKMTIRETIVALKKLPKQTKELAIEQYNKYYALANKYYKLAVEKMDKEYKKLMEQYEKLQQQYLIKRAELLKEARPYTKPVMEAYKWLENEIKETVVFIYKYHKLSERYTLAKNYITSEYKRIVPLIKVTVHEYVQQSKVLAAKYAQQYKALAVKYSKQYKLLAVRYANEYSVKAQDYVIKTASKAGHATLRGIHSTMKMIKNFNLKAYTAQVKSYINFVKKYVTIDTKKGEFVISIPCDATPSFSHHINKVQKRMRRSVENIKVQSNQVIQRIEDELKDLKIKAFKLKNQIQRQIMENTVELRKDIAMSYNANKRIADRLYTNGKLLAQKTYNKAMNLYKSYKPKAMRMLKKVKVDAKQFYQKFSKISFQAYLKASQLLRNMYKVGATKTYQQFVIFSTRYAKATRAEAMKLYKKYQPIVKRNSQKYINVLKVKAKQAKTELEPYYKAIKTAVLKVKNGMPMKQAFFPIYREMVFASKFYKQKMMDSLKKMKVQSCRSDPKLCKYIKESVNVHTDIYEKYSTRSMDYVNIAKANVAKFIRLAKYKIQSKKMFSADYNEVAMIIGNNHILTFDNKFYDIPDIKKPGCQYLLAHDFADDKFTLMKGKDSIVITTPEMTIEIKDNGITKATIGKKVITSLPVESSSGECKRKSHRITCHFHEQKIKVSVNLRNSFTKISMSGWHFGKSQGLLGTNNRESYDDTKLPNGEIAKNIFKFVNAYETSGNRKCKLQETSRKTTCQKLPSSKCEELFRSESSPFASFFNSVDPEPFFRACELDTSDCKNKENKKVNHCSTAAAYVSMSRARSNFVSHLPECLYHEQHSVDEEWIQKPNKNVDIVFMMSQRRNVFTSRKQVAKMIIQLQKSLRVSNDRTRYALIGFGGKGIHESAHSHPLGKGVDVFGNAAELAKEITSMPYEGVGTTSNDAYQAILTASRLRFRAGASKVFIMFNTEPHNSHEHGPAYDEAYNSLKNEANAALFVFDKFNFKRIAGAGQVIGQTTQKLYTTRHLTGLPENIGDFPFSEFTTMAKATNGGWFSSRVKVPKQTARSLYKAISANLRVQSNQCKTCRVEATYTDVPRVICVANPAVKC